MTEAEESRECAVLRERHRIGPGEEDDFRVRNLSEITDARAASQRILTLLLIGGGVDRAAGRRVSGS